MKTPPQWKTKTTDNIVASRAKGKQMIRYHTYYIEFRRNGKAEQLKSYQAANPGHAFQKCCREFPGAELIRGWRQSDLKDEVVGATYEPPSTVRIVAGSKAKAEQTFFGFLKDISLNPKKQASPATHRPFPLKLSQTQN